MNAYFLSDGGAVVRGPFVEEQLMGMWRAGEMTANALVCLEGSEDWTLWRDEVAAMEGLHLQEAATKRRAAAARAEMAAAQQARRKSEGVGLALGFLLPGAGHLYAGEMWQGLLGLGCVVAMVLTVPFFGLAMWALILVDAPGAVRRFNRRL